VADTYNTMIRSVVPVGSDWVVSTLAGIPRFAEAPMATNRAAQFNYPFAFR